MKRLKHPITRVDHCKGRQEAPVEIVVYGDYASRNTFHVQKMFDVLIQTFSYEINYVFRHFPGRTVHPPAFERARLAEAAGLQEKFWEMHQRMFQKQGTVNIESCRRLALEIGLDADHFSRDLNKQRINYKIHRDWESGLSSGVTDIPAIFINSVRYTAVPDEIELRTYLELLLIEPYFWL